MTIRTPYRTIAALGLAALIAVLQTPQGHASPAAASSGADEAGDGVGLTGQEVTGGANAGDAAELSVDAAYVDEFTGSSLHYRIPRVLEDSTVHVGVTVPDEAGAEDFAGFEVELGTWDGDRCSSDSHFGGELDTAERLRSVHVAAGRDPEVDTGEDPCAEQDELVLIIGPTDNAEDDLQGREFGLTVYEEPQPESGAPAEAPDYGDLEWTDIGRDVSGATAAEPGRSFAEATELSAGSTYDLTISPGEVQIYRVPLSWGERLQAEAFFPEPGDSLSDQLSSMGSVSLATLNPMRDIVGGDFNSLMSSMSTELRNATAPVAWENRFDRETAGASLAGDYYLLVAADPYEGEDVSLDFMLTLDTFDDAGVSAPAYPAGSEDARPDFAGGASGDEDESGSSDGDEGSDGIEDEGAETADSEDSGEVTAVERIRSIGDSTGVVASLAAFALLMLATGSLFMVRAIRQRSREGTQAQARGRSSSQQPPPPHHQPPHWR